MHYAKSADVHIAYQVAGEGPIDLVFVNGWVTNLQLMWEDAGWSAFFRRLASFSRLILFDKRGTGLSDRVSVREMPTLEERMDDVRAVMDAVGSRQAFVFGVSEGGPMSVLFAASYPERTQGLVLYGSFPRITSSEDYPWGFLPEQVEPLLALAERSWGDGTFSGNLVAPSELPGRLPYFARLEREGASPGAVIALIRMVADIDVRAVLHSIPVPTLIIHRDRDAIAPIEGARYMSGQIPRAQFVELEGEHSPLAGDTDTILDRVEEFVTGRRGERHPDRVLATVMFTDIVDSTSRAAALGDRRWSELLEDHYRLIRQQLPRFGGLEVKTIGDGFLATFDGPARAVRCALAAIEANREIGVILRAGLHTGECERRGEDIAGIAVHIGARVAALAGPGEVLVSRTVKDLVAGSGLQFEDRGSYALKGVPDDWHIFAVSS
ncbi:MAG TPA: adenylate/guanylate cyclase domain-containing protein [Solirubrobacteraceae bacterium]|nr:adenylate/guanylate cyclase domain-containing protein [Solirubrobacteraceae bacterium]